MTDSEKFEAHGRARAGLKQAKFDLAAAHSKLSAYVEVLRDTTSAIEHFLKEPLSKSHVDQRPIADYGYSWNSAIRKENLPDLVHDVFMAAKRLEKLQAEVDAFEK